MKRLHPLLFILSLNYAFVSCAFAQKTLPVAGKATIGKTYPGHKLEVCFTEFTAAEKKRGLINVVIDTYQSSLLSPNSNESLWDHDFLKQHPDYKIALDEYLKDKRGHKIKSLDLHHKTAQEIHSILTKEGFKHKRTPLMVRKTVLKDRGYYWLNNGEMTTDPKHADLVVMDIYVHDDGSMVRVKPESTPDHSKRTALRFPHYSKNVLLKLDDVCDDKKVCTKDISYTNEAFKLTREGNPLPKNIKAESGFRFLYPKNNKRKRAMQADVVMNLIHFNLPTQCARKADWLDDSVDQIDTIDATVKKEVSGTTHKVVGKSTNNHVKSAGAKSAPMKFNANTHSAQSNSVPTAQR